MLVSVAAMVAMMMSFDQNDSSFRSERHRRAGFVKNGHQAKNGQQEGEDQVFHGFMLVFDIK